MLLPWTKPKGEGVVTRGLTPRLYILYFFAIDLAGPYKGTSHLFYIISLLFTITSSTHDNIRYSCLAPV
jgi:hypothetical protein